MDAKKALEQIYNALRLLSVNAETHEQLKGLVQIVLNELNKPETIKEKEDGNPKE